MSNMSVCAVFEITDVHLRDVLRDVCRERRAACAHRVPHRRNAPQGPARLQLMNTERIINYYYDKSVVRSSICLHWVSVYNMSRTVHAQEKPDESHDEGPRVSKTARSEFS